MLLPALSSAKRASHNAACTSNQRQIGIALAIYATDHNDAMPLIWERNWGDPPVPGAPGNGRGHTVFGMLMTKSGIPMGAFRCPADRRRYVLSETNFWQPLPSELPRELELFPFDYSAIAIGWGMDTCRIPWSFPKGNEFKSTRIPTPSTMYMIWDGYEPTWTSGVGWIGARDLLVSMEKAPPNHFIFATLFRHSATRGDGRCDMRKGPNSILADGHVEQRVNLVRLDDNYFNVPGK